MQKPKGYDECKVGGRETPEVGGCVWAVCESDEEILERLNSPQYEKLRPYNRLVLALGLIDRAEENLTPEAVKEVKRLVTAALLGIGYSEVTEDEIAEVDRIREGKRKG